MVETYEVTRMIKETLTLDIGCGYAEHHVPSKKADIKLDLVKGKANFIADAHHLPFRPESFSKVMMYEVIEHLENPKQALSEIHRVLKKEGILELTTPNIMFIGNYFWWILNPKKTEIKDHIYAWRMSELRNLIELARLKITLASFVDSHYWRPARFARISIFPRLTKHHLFIQALKTA